MKFADSTPCDIVAFVAHPDDAELNCGGTLAAAVRAGRRAAIVEFTRGELGSRGTPEIRAEEASKAGRVLGLSDRVNLGLPDGHLHDTDDSRRLVVEALRALRPAVVIAPPIRDHHPDHAAVGEVVARSFYLAGIVRYPGAGEPHRPHALLHYVGSQPDVPTIVQDITDVYETRTEALLCFASQLHREDSSEPATRIAHRDFLGAIEGRLRHFGSLIGVRYGEAFTSPAPVPTRDVGQLFALEPWRAEDGGR